MSVYLAAVRAPRRQFTTTPKGLHTMRLLVGAALGLRMAADLDLSDPDYFYLVSDRRKLVLGARDRRRLAECHPGAAAFFAMPLTTAMGPETAAALADFLDTAVPPLPLHDADFRKQFARLRDDLRYVARHSLQWAFSQDC